MARFLVACLGSACRAAASAAERLGGDLAEAYTKRFPDGEAYVRVDAEARGRPALAVFTGYPGPSERLVEAMLLVEALRGLGASPVVAAALYMPYSRQDRRFLRGEPVSVAAALGGLASAGAWGFVAVDIHKEWSLDWFPGPAVNVDPSPVLAEAVRPLLGGGPVYVVAPDRGALGRAHRLAERLGAAFDYLEKRRDRVTGEVRLEPKSIDVKGAEVVIVDDIISTGGTVAKAAGYLLGLGASRVIVAATHCLLVGNARERLREAGVEKLVCSNTVEAGADSVADVGPLVAEAAAGIVERLVGYEQEAPKG